MFFPTWWRVNGGPGSELFVKVGHIILTFEKRHERRRHLPLQNFIPLDTREESVFSDGESVSVPGPEPLVHRPVEQLLQDVLRVRGEVVLELELPLEHSLRDGLPVGAGEGRGSGQHVMNQDAETPPVHLLAMPTMEYKRY